MTLPGIVNSMEATKTASALSRLALAGAVALLIFAMLYRSRAGGIPPLLQLWSLLTLLWLALAIFASWKYRTAAARWAFWILFPLSALIVYGVILQSASEGFFRE